MCLPGPADRVRFPALILVHQRSSGQARQDHILQCVSAAACGDLDTTPQPLQPNQPVLPLGPQDAGLPVCIVALGGKVVPPGEVGQAGAPRGPVALVLGEGEEETEPACGGWSVVVRAPELLVGAGGAHCAPIIASRWLRACPGSQSGTVTAGNCAVGC